MHSLSKLVLGLPQFRAVGNGWPDIRDVTYDSRRVQPGDLFVAIRGLRDDGARHIGEAVARGAVAIVADRSDIDLPNGVVLLVVPDARRALALLAAAIWGNPGSRLGLVGVTGTDGKTTTATLTAEIFEAAGIPTGLLTTVEVRVGDLRLPNGFHHTTPEAPEVQSSLARMLRVGARRAVLEVSSHGLALDRVAGCQFQVAVITNVGLEHLDFHGGFEQYRAAKRRLFDLFPTGLSGSARPIGIINADDPSADYFRSGCPAEVLTYGIERRADVRARDIVLESDRTRFVVDTPIGSRLIRTRFVGRFNVHNWLAAIAVAIGQGMDWDPIERAAESAEPVRGRMQRIDEGQPFTVIVDFAHTPQALAAVLEGCRVLTRGRIITVLGHPGERYAENRRRLGVVAAQGSDLAIVTTDDSYGEDPGQIMDQVARGVELGGGREGRDYLVVPDRRQAIRKAFELARPGDLALIVGRGHLSHLTSGARCVPFDDAEVARESLRGILRRTA